MLPNFKMFGNVDWDSLTARQRVLNRLLSARINNERILLHNFYDNKHFISGGFLPIWELQHKTVGGSSGDRRLRELRTEHNVPIELHDHKLIRGDKTYNTPVYRIKLTPYEINAYDWTPAWAKPFKWRYPVKFKPNERVKSLTPTRSRFNTFRVLYQQSDGRVIVREDDLNGGVLQQIFRPDELERL